MRRSLEPYRNRILNLWALGRTATEISDAIGNVRGAKFKPPTISTFIDRARAAGDHRARRRRILNHGTDQA